MLKKSIETETDIELFLLEYRNTPVAGLKVSPNEMLMSRFTRTRIPISDNILRPKIVPNIRETMIEQKNKIKKYYDKSARKRPDFKEGDKIVYKNNKIWEPAIVIQKHETPRSYLIKDEDNRTKRRNSRHLRKSENSPNFRNRNFDQENMTNETDINHTRQNSLESDNRTDNHRLNNTDNNVNLNRTNIEHPTSSHYTNRYGRAIKPPERLNL